MERLTMQEREMRAKTRERVRRVLQGDPYGELSDYAIAAELGVSEATVQRHRVRLMVPSAMTRRRHHPEARSVVCVCGAEYLLMPARITRLCHWCGTRATLPGDATEALR